MLKNTRFEDQPACLHRLAVFLSRFNHLLNRLLWANNSQKNWRSRFRLERCFVVRRDVPQQHVLRHLMTAKPKIYPTQATPRKCAIPWPYPGHTLLRPGNTYRVWPDRGKSSFCSVSSTTFLLSPMTYSWGEGQMMSMLGLVTNQKRRPMSPERHSEKRLRRPTQRGSFQLEGPGRWRRCCWLRRGVRKRSKKRIRGVGCGGGNHLWG